MEKNSVEYKNSRRIVSYIKKELYEKLRKWRFQNEINSESEAIEILIEKALDQEQKTKQ